MLRDGADDLLAIISEAATQPALKHWELEAAAHDGSLGVSVSHPAPGSSLLEALHAAAYGAESPLGHALPVVPGVLPDITTSTLRAFLGDRVTGGGGVLSAVNVDHGALVAAAQRLLVAPLAEGAPSAATAAAPAVHVGGEVIVRGAQGPAVVGLALAAPAAGGASSAAAVRVLVALLGGTGPHGGAGGTLRLGPHRLSRLARSVHSEAHSFIAAADSLAVGYSDSGLLALVGRAADHEAGRLASVLCGFVRDAATMPASAPELARAKIGAKLAVLASVESRAATAAEAASRALFGGPPPTALLSAIDAVTAAELQAVAVAALASPPAFAAFGPSLASLPRYDALAALLK